RADRINNWPNLYWNNSTLSSDPTETAKARLRKLLVNSRLFNLGFDFSHCIRRQELLRRNGWQRLDVHDRRKIGILGDHALFDKTEFTKVVDHVSDLFY